MIELHSSPTSNGQKIMIMLEETGLEWQHLDVNIRLGDQFKPEYSKLSPNHKIPSIVDTDGPGGGRYTMMESGAILVYLAEKTGRFMPKDSRNRYDAMQWLFFQMAHVGPMFGQANHFDMHADNNDYARNRYNKEVIRLLQVLENRLKESQWVGCEELTVADIATYPWCNKWHKDHDLDNATFPNVIRWLRAMEARPAVRRSNEMALEIRARMSKKVESTTSV